MVLLAGGVADFSSWREAAVFHEELPFYNADFENS